MFVSETIVRSFEGDEDGMNKFRENMGFVACDRETVVPMNLSAVLNEKKSLSESDSRSQFKTRTEPTETSSSSSGQ